MLEAGNLDYYYIFITIIIITIIVVFIVIIITIMGMDGKDSHGGHVQKDRAPIAIIWHVSRFSGGWGSRAIQHFAN